MTDFEVFHSMTQYLEAHPSRRVIAMVYLHPICQMRFDGAGRFFLRLFQHLCGEHYFPNVVIVTTHWNCATDLTRPEWEARENNLCEDNLIWGDMIAKGASCLRYDSTCESSKNIIEVCLCKSGPNPLQSSKDIIEVSLCKGGPNPPHFVSELQKGVTSDDIIFPILSNPTGRPRAHLDAEGQAEVEKEVQRLREEFEQDYEDYREREGSIKADKRSLE